MGGSVVQGYGVPSPAGAGHSFVLVGRDGGIERRADYIADAIVGCPVAISVLARALRR